MAETFTEKELLKFLKAMRSGKKKKGQLLRFHIYGVIDQRADEYSFVEDALQSVQQYGSAEVIHVEVVDDENG